MQKPIKNLTGNHHQNWIVRNQGAGSPEKWAESLKFQSLGMRTNVVVCMRLRLWLTVKLLLNGDYLYVRCIDGLEKKGGGVRWRGWHDSDNFNRFTWPRVCARFHKSVWGIVLRIQIHYQHTDGVNMLRVEAVFWIPYWELRVNHRFIIFINKIIASACANLAYLKYMYLWFFN